MGKKYVIRVDGKEYRVEVEEEREEKEAKETKKRVVDKETTNKQEIGEAKGKAVVAPMPAKVVKVNCEAGKRVGKGDLLIVLEAMKMENEILSSVDGVVKEVRVIEGASVSLEEIMIVFE